MSIKQRIDKEDVVHIYNGILHSHKKEQNNAICSDVDGPRDDHTEEVSQLDNDKYHITSPIHRKEMYKRTMEYYSAIQKKSSHFYQGSH